ncbi:MAG: YceI family protein [Caldilineales bacterium]|nr:YceI family protein [Caldilineales bacterium]
MKRRLLTIALVLIAALFVLTGILVYAFVLRPPEEASAPIVATPVIIASTPAPPTPTAMAANPTDSPLPTPTAVAMATAEPTATPTPASGGLIVFTIVPAESEARFLIDEVLRGQPKTVVGVTNQVAGELAVDPAHPTGAVVGPIVVNARTLVTDNNFRNNAIKNRILLTNTYEFVTFEPTAIRGLPTTVTIGQPFEFEIEGHLTITDETRTVVFAVTVTPVSAERIEGLARTTILWRDFGLFIPDSPSVDTVADEVTLELEFVAVPKS